MLKHADIWQAIDKLAQMHGFSPSGLARKAGLSPTIFNPSKRTGEGRNRWPSTESLAAILEATGTNLDEFVALASSRGAVMARLPLLGLAEAAKPGYFTEQGTPQAKIWDTIELPGATDPQAFVLEVSGKMLEPVFREGDKLLFSPASVPRRGDKVGVRLKTGEVLVRLLGREGGHKFELLSFHPDYPPLTLSRRDVDWLHRIIWASQ